ncbi:hypothetical protein DID77_02200 [Candidatus Marinamargulisbacteria bacterium SCGC AG-439-L15]|nr:hypothetical protein DID77_02200 [Candidatus Marinamargulisbacteria bacterium SCGC AG-439-L15]
MSNHSQILDGLIPHDSVSTYQSIHKPSLEEVYQSIGHSNTRFVRMTQVHGNQATWIDKSHLSEPGESIEIKDTDALITQEKDVLLSVKTADCLPILIAHPNGVVACIHAGRAGTEAKITSKTLDLIQQKTGLSKGFYIWLGPAICKACYEIDATQKKHYDLLAKNLDQLSELSSHSHIIKSNRCTACEHDRFFSYRKGDAVNRNYSLIKLNGD